MSEETLAKLVDALSRPKFLDVALNGGARLILTGDGDLLALHPLYSISIASPADFLAGERAG